LAWTRLVALGLLLAACSPATGSGGPPGLLRIAMTTEPTSLSPLFAINDYESFVDRFMFDVLVTVASDGRTLVPRLAAAVPSRANGGISPDGLTLTYHLRHGVRWHDGAPFTSADVAFSFAAIINPRNDVPNRHGYDMVRSLRTPDPYTVVVRLRAPYAPALTTLFSDETPGGILPRHLLAGYRDLNRIGFNDHPVGTGPYRFVRWDRGQSVELAAYPGYYLGAPKIARISVRIVPDEATIIDELRTVELDLFSEASVDAYGRLRGLPGVHSVLVDEHAATNLLLNTTRPALRDVRVRRAIALAIDKGAIVRDFTFGAGEVASEDLPSFMWAYDPAAKSLPFDPVRARAELKAAGWLPGASGLAAKGGRPLHLVLAYAQNNATSRLVAVEVQSELLAVGIDLELKGYNALMMFAPAASGGVYRSGHFDLALYTMTLGIDPDSASRFSCNAVPPSGQNYSRYCSPEMDAAQSAGRSTYDTAARKRAYARSQELLARDVPIVFLFWPKDVAAFNRRLRGFSPNPDVPSWNAQEWSLR
jgi:peptide/nickel transport system substrate-binding protein